MRLIFMGTPELAKTVLQALLDSPAFKSPPWLPSPTVPKAATFASHRHPLNNSPCKQASPFSNRSAPATRLSSHKSTSCIRT